MTMTCSRLLSVLLLTVACVTGAFAVESTTDEILNREDDLRNTIENSESSMSEASEDVVQTGVDIGFIIWVVAAPIVLGVIFLSGLLAARRDGVRAAQNHGVVFVLGVIGAGIIFTFFL